MLKLLDVLLPVKTEFQNKRQVLQEEFANMEDLIAYRKKAREEKNWAVADRIRIALDECGIVVKDSKDGTVIEAK